MFSTRDPPTVQQMPWPVGEDGEGIEEEIKSTLTYDTWLINDLDFSWLVESDGERKSKPLSFPLKSLVKYILSKSRRENRWMTKSG